MRVLILTKGQHTVVDDATYEWASKFKWYAKEAKHTFYAVRQVRLPNGKLRLQYLHREILGTPKGLFTDHIDGDGLNNLNDNLRICTISENNRNARKRQTNTSGFRGVSFCKLTRSWDACISVGNKNTHLGLFDQAIEAAVAYDKAALQLYGAFARLNFPAVNTTVNNQYQHV